MLFITPYVVVLVCRIEIMGQSLSNSFLSVYSQLLVRLTFFGLLCYSLPGYVSLIIIRSLIAVYVALIDVLG